MLLKLGVDISRLGREIRRTLNVIEEVHNEDTDEAVITSTYEGNHSPGSLHYNNNAVDVTSRLTKSHAERARRIKKKLGKDFDVVPEFDHIHVEYDPK